MTDCINIRQLNRCDYTTVWHEMKSFTDQRSENTNDEVWLVEHPPVFTLGQSGKLEHVLNPGAIPVIHVDRGGQVTYHGPGQLVAYVLFDIRRHNMGIRQLVSLLEKTTIDLLSTYGITAATKEGMPGVYVNDAKICSLGLRIRKGYSYHGLSLNVGMDLEPFTRINPCGFKNLSMTQIKDQGGPSQLSEVTPVFLRYLLDNLRYTGKINFVENLFP